MITIPHVRPSTKHNPRADLTPLFDALADVAISRDVPGPELLALVAQARPALAAIATAPKPGEPYSRSILRVDDQVEIMVARWRPGHRCAPHDHGGAGGFVIAVEGDFQERRFRWEGAQLVAAETTTYSAGEAIGITADDIHDMAAEAGGVSLHFYSLPAPGMRLFDMERAEVVELVGNYGAWIPEGDHPRIPFSDVAPKTKTAPLIWVAHTTHYRGGSGEFAVAAATMARELAAAHPDAEVVISALHHKADFLAEMAQFTGSGRVLNQLHLISHAGM
ncbi:MAG TPA: cysteine dioxygenase family protein, partial [Mycobacterium sp.]